MVSGIFRVGCGAVRVGCAVEASWCWGVLSVGLNYF